MKIFIKFTFSFLVVNGAFAQSPCNNVKNISPVSPKPTDTVVTNTCSAFTVQWKGQPSQSFVFTAVEKDPETNNVVATFNIKEVANAVTIFPKAGSLVRWQIEAISAIDGRNFYSYPLRGGKDFIIPRCTTPITAAARPKAEALKISGNLNNSIIVYPNPFQATLKIQFSTVTSSPKIISLFDINGKMISTQTTTKNIAVFNAKLLSAGIYIIRIRNKIGNTIYIGKVVKE